MIHALWHAPGSGQISARRWLARLALALGIILGGLGGSLAFSPTAAEAGGPDASSGVMLRLAFSPGQVQRYAYTMQMDYRLVELGTIRMNMDMQLAYRVEQVHADRSATVAGTIERFTATMNGDPLPVQELNGFTTRMRIQPNGAVSDVQVDPASAARLGAQGMQLPMLQGQGTGMGALGSFELPDRPLRAGEFVDRQMTLDLASLGIQGVTAPASMTARSRLTMDGVTTQGGRRVAQLTEVATASLPGVSPEPGVSLSAEIQSRSTQALDVANGWPISGNGTMGGNVSVMGPDRSVQTQTATINMAMQYSFRTV
jgi:hypothetical protein